MLFSKLVFRIHSPRYNCLSLQKDSPEQWCHTQGQKPAHQYLCLLWNWWVRDRACVCSLPEPTARQAYGWSLNVPNLFLKTHVLTNIFLLLDLEQRKKENWHDGLLHTPYTVTNKDRECGSIREFLQLQQGSLSRFLILCVIVCGSV